MAKKHVEQHTRPTAKRNSQTGRRLAQQEHTQGHWHYDWLDCAIHGWGCTRHLLPPAPPLEEEALGVLVGRLGTKAGLAAGLAAVSLGLASDLGLPNLLAPGACTFALVALGFALALALALPKAHITRQVTTGALQTHGFTRAPFSFCFFGLGSSWTGMVGALRLTGGVVS